METYTNCDVCGRACYAEVMGGFARCPRCVWSWKRYQARLARAQAQMNPEAEALLKEYLALTGR